jgi:hypothetical protein
MSAGLQQQAGSPGNSFIMGKGGLPVDLNRVPFLFGSVQGGGGLNPWAGECAPISIHPKPEREQMGAVGDLASGESLILWS